ncbi:MAG TPA: hypothetical protein VGK67_23620 [Myxococcales bacterium]|jgi:hypothetical protein
MGKPPTELALTRLEGVPEALARARGENLSDLYAAWRDLLAAQARAASARAREAEALEVRAQMLLRSVENARALSLGAPARDAPAPGAEPGKKRGKGGKKAAAKAEEEKALAAADPLAGFIAESQKELDAARAALAARVVDEERFFAAELAQVKERIRVRAAALLLHHRPRVEVRVQPVGKDRSIVHLTRPEPQDLVLIAFLLSGKLFTRYDAFFDDSVDQLGLEPPRFYAEERNPSARFDRLEDEEALLFDPARVFLPVKGMFAFQLPGHPFPRFRVMNRGPVLEAEARAEGGAWENLMPRASAELLSGLFIKLKIEKRIELVLRVA